MALATKKDFEARHEDADDRVEPLLEDASSLILNAVSGSEAKWVTEDDPGEIPGEVVAVCVEVAFRAWSNPEGLRSESLGEFAQAWHRDSAQVLRLTKEERRIVRRAAGVGTAGAVTLESPYSGEGSESIFDSELPL